MLPIDFKDAWFDKEILQLFKRLKGLIRPKHFMTALILNISALITIITSFKALSVTLVSQMKPAYLVNDLNKNISLMLLKQQIIDKKVEANFDALEDVVLGLGQEVENIKIQLSNRCHASFRYICIMPLAYDKQHNWTLI